MHRKTLPYWFTPEYQPSPESAVEFHLKPLDQETLYIVQHSKGLNPTPAWPGIRAAFEKGVIGWKNVTIDGAAVDFDAVSAQRILRQIGSADWMIWLGAIGGELYTNAFLSAEEKKT